MKQGRSLKQAKAEQAAKKRRAKKRKRILVLLAEIFTLMMLLGIGYVITKNDRLPLQQPNNEEIQVNEGVSQDGYTTIALFGGESSGIEQPSGTHVDTILVVSVDKESKEIRSVSIYRDLLTMQNNGEIKKANSSYFSGGPIETMNMLNHNFDLSIQEYVSVDYRTMVTIVDSLGGIEIDVTSAEVEELNRQIADVAETIEQEATSVQEGLQTLDGIQTVAYAKISKNSLGGDVARTEREKSVIQKIHEKMKQSDSAAINEMMNQIIGQISASYEAEEFVELVCTINQYELKESKGFAFEYTEGTIDGIGSVFIPLGFTENVQELHAFLFPNNDYVVSGAIYEIADQIEHLKESIKEEVEDEKSSGDIVE